MKVEQNIILIAGPTASGKTSAAIKLAQENHAVIINADSMQVYSDLRIITARPNDDELDQASHHLFGHVSGNKAYSVAEWLEDIASLLGCFKQEKRQVILVGGTGLYFNALLEGLSPMPEIKPEIRRKWRDGNYSVKELHDALIKLDPQAANTLRDSDRQRMIRALEVLESTGKSILEWQSQAGVPLVHKDDAQKLLIMPERSLLHERINMRFDQMVEEGALQEVQALLELNLPQNASVMKAIGVPQFSAHLRGDISLEEAIEKAKAATRQYAKRQCTWFNNSFGDGWARL